VESCKIRKINGGEVRRNAFAANAFAATVPDRPGAAVATTISPGPPTQLQRRRNRRFWSE